MATVTIPDLDDNKLCHKGARRWCRKNGVDWSKLISVGIDESELSHIDDCMLHKAINSARIRELNDGR